MKVLLSDGNTKWAKGAKSLALLAALLMESMRRTELRWTLAVFGGVGGKQDTQVFKQIDANMHMCDGERAIATIIKNTPGTDVLNTLQNLPSMVKWDKSTDSDKDEGTRRVLVTLSDMEQAGEL